EERLPLLVREGEDGAVGAAVVEVDVARAAGQDPLRGEAVADELHRGELGADDEAALALLVEPERGDPVLRPVEDGGLRGRRRAGQPGGEAAKLPALLLEEAPEDGNVAAPERALEVLVGPLVDLDDDEAAPRLFGVRLPPPPPLGRERKVLDTVVPVVERTSQASPPVLLRS